MTLKFLIKRVTISLKKTSIKFTVFCSLSGCLQVEASSSEEADRLAYDALAEFIVRYPEFDEIEITGVDNDSLSLRPDGGS